MTHARHFRVLAVPALTVALVTAASFLSGCGGSDPEPMGRVELTLTDAPFPSDMVESTDVVIERVSVRVGGGADEESGWVTVADEPLEVNLLDLQNGVTETLASELVPVGTIDQIRLVVSSAEVTLTDGRTFDLDIPSGDASGIKVFPEPPIEIVGELTSELLIDFDVSQSFSAIPNAPNNVEEIELFHFHPVLRVANLSEVGTVSGTVRHDGGTSDDPSDDVPIADVVITAYSGREEITSTMSAEDGQYKIMGLAAGSYTLTATGNGFASQSVSVEVLVGNDVGGNDFYLSDGDGS